jgi:hypothetical protein
MRWPFGLEAGLGDGGEKAGGRLNHDLLQGQRGQVQSG